jgi:hypothetical protein
MHTLFFLPLYVGLSFTANVERSQQFRVIDASTHQPLADVRVKHMVLNDNMLFSRGSADYTLGPTGADGMVVADHIPTGSAHSFFRFSRPGYVDSTVRINGDLLPETLMGSPAADAAPLKRVRGGRTITVPLHRMVGLPNPNELPRPLSPKGE